MILCNDSILESIKKAMGIQADYTHFDPEIVMHINSVFSILHQLGVGPKEPFFIDGADPTWDQFTEDKAQINSVRTYVYAKVKLIFDPPTSSFGIKGLEEMCKEFEWRLNVADDHDE